MRITAVEPSGNLYGSEQALFDVVRGTDTLGFEWDVVVPDDGLFEKLLRSAGIPVRALLPRNSHLIPRRKKLIGYLRLARHLAAHRPSVVYLNQAGMLRAMSAICERLRIPIVCQIQTLEDAQFVASNASLQNGAVSFICNSRFIAAVASVRAERLSTLYQPILKRSARTVSTPPGKGEWRIGILGRIAESKGHYVFLAAAKHLAEASDANVQFVVIGEGLERSDTEKYVQAVKEAGLSKSFDFRGFRADVEAELSGIHALVIPSIAEPLGRVVLDACLARRPIIVSDAGGLGEMSRALDIGIRVPAGDPAAIASTIAALLDNYQLEYDRFEEAAARVERQLTPEPYLRAIASVLNNAAHRQPTSLEWFGEAP